MRRRKRERFPRALVAGVAAAIVAGALIWPHATEPELDFLRAGDQVLPVRTQEFPRPPADFKRIARTNSPYSTVTVLDNGQLRLLMLGQAGQSAARVIDDASVNIQRPVVPYIRAFTFSKAMREETDSALFIGLGAGSAASWWATVAPNDRIDAFEIDPDVAHYAERYFSLPKEVDVRVGDGRALLAASSDRWDVIFTDTYLQHAVPFHMATREYLQVVRAHLEPEGIAVTNVLGALSGKRSGLVAANARTWKHTFRYVRLLPLEAVRGADGSWSTTSKPQNVLFFGSDKPLPDTAALRQIAQSDRTAGWSRKQPPDWYDAGFPGDAPLLTDDYAPVERLVGT